MVIFILVLTSHVSLILGVGTDIRQSEQNWPSKFFIALKHKTTVINTNETL